MIKHLITLVVIGLVTWRVSVGLQNSGETKFPNKPIQIVVPYLAGGGTDTFTRILQKSLIERDTLGVPIVIINQEGGSGTIGSRYVKDSKPDGYRLLCHHEAIMATKLAGVVNYGTEAFRPIAQTASVVLLMVVRADSPYQSLTDLLEAAQEDPNKIRIGANQGSPAYFICKQLLSEYEGADFNFISAGGSKRYTYLLGNKLEAGIFSLAEYVNFRNADDAPLSDNILAIGNFSKEPHPRIPDVKTSTQQGLSTSAENAYYVWAPKGTPDDVAETLAAAFKSSLEDPMVIEEFNKLSIDSKFRSGDELKAHLKTRVEAFEKLAVEAQTDLPDFPAWTIGIVAALLAFVGFDSFRKYGTGESAFDPTDPDDPLGGPPRFNVLGVCSLALLLAYVAALHYGIGFVIATPIAIFLMGMTIAKWKPNWLLSIAQLAILFSLGVEFIFTQLFTVALP